jgi:hypothetical protein
LVVCDLSQPSVRLPGPYKRQRNVSEDGGDRSPKTKAVTGYRTPKQEAEEIIQSLKEINKRIM